MEKMELGELIQRLEKCEGPDRELDGEISIMLFGENLAIHVGDGRPGSHFIVRDDCPEYTSSLDAALTLVPEGWTKDIWMKRHNGHHWSVTLHIPSYQHDGRHEQLAVAICIASLRARQSGSLQKKEEG